MESPLRARPLSVAEPTLTGVGEANAIEESKETVIARGRVTFMLVETVKIGNEWSGEVQGAKCCYNRGKAEDGWGMFRCLMESAPVFISIRHNNAMCLVLYL